MNTERPLLPLGLGPLLPDPPGPPVPWDDLDDTDFDEESDAERDFQAWQSEYDHNTSG